MQVNLVVLPLRSHFYKIHLDQSAKSALFHLLANLLLRHPGLGPGNEHRVGNAFWDRGLVDGRHDCFWFRLLRLLRLFRLFRLLRLFRLFDSFDCSLVTFPLHLFLIQFFFENSKYTFIGLSLYYFTIFILFRIFLLYLIFITKKID